MELYKLYREFRAVQWPSHVRPHPPSLKETEFLFLMNIRNCLDYSRAEVAATARPQLMR